MKITDINELQKIANDIRINIVKTVYNAQSGHPGGSLSCADILTVLYFNQMNINPNEPKAEGRDRLVLSKGHSSPALYSTLAKRVKGKGSTFRANQARWHGSARNEEQFKLASEELSGKF